MLDTQLPNIGSNRSVLRPSTAAGSDELAAVDFAELLSLSFVLGALFVVTWHGDRAAGFVYTATEPVFHCMEYNHLILFVFVFVFVFELCLWGWVKNL